MKRFEVVGSDIVLGLCSKCGKAIKYGEVPVRVVKVIDHKENREEWRCNNCVRHLSPEVARKLTRLELEDALKRSQDTDADKG